MLSLVIDQPPLALQPSSVAGERTVGSYHAMTGDDDADRIGSIGQSYGAHGRRFSQSKSEFAVANGLSCRDGTQRLPDVLLEGGSLRGYGEGIDSLNISIEIRGNG